MTITLPTEPVPIYVVVSAPIGAAFDGQTIVSDRGDETRLTLRFRFEAAGVAGRRAVMVHPFSGTQMAQMHRIARVQGISYDTPVDFPADWRS